jgi:type I restriction enzyme S subunit
MKLVPLKDFCKMYQPPTISTKEMVPNGAYVVYGANGPIGRYDKFNHEDSQLLVTCRGATCGAVNISEPFSWINGNAMVIQPNKNLATLEYMKYAFMGGIDVSSAITGSAQPQITRTTLEVIKVPLPSLEKQSEIVQKLDSAFAEIEILEGNLGLSDEKANQLLQSILNSEYSLSGIQLESLEKLVDILDNQRIPVNATERLERIGDIPYYGATGQVGTIDKAIFNETLILLGEDGVPFFDPTKHKAYEISGPSWVNNHAHVLRAKSEIVIQRYLLHFLNIFNYTGYVNGATRLKLTQGDMKRIPVPLPAMDVQEKIVAKVDLVFEEIRILTAQISQKREFAVALRQSLLSSAFNELEVVA